MPTISSFTKIIKSDGSLEDFDGRKIYQAILKAGKASGEFGEDTAQYLADKVARLLRQAMPEDLSPKIEQIQEMIEDLLMTFPYKKKRQGIHRIPGGAGPSKKRQRGV